MKKYVIIFCLVTAVLIAQFWLVNVRVAKAPTDGLACTQEAKLCPDGSAVGRTGPNCKFAECPLDLPTSLEAHIDQEIGTLGIRIVPMAVLEDSRCPIDVTCIQAGTVRVRARFITSLGESTQEFKLNQATTTEVEKVTLTEVLPLPKAGVKIKNSEYLFTFEVAKREDVVVPSSGSGVRGTVLLGPTCPVMRDPPDPACAEKPYATAIEVYRAGSKSPFVIGNSDTSGAFEFSLPPGAYTLSAKGGAMLPRCTETKVTVVPKSYATTSISCDTGIR